MMHVKRWIYLFVACVGASAVLASPAAANPPAGHVAAPPEMRSEMARDVRESSTAPGEMRRMSESPGFGAAENNPRIPETASYTIVPVYFFPPFWFGRPPSSESFGAGCTKATYGPTVVGLSDPTDFFQHISSSCGFDSGQSLAPGQNKDALYGPAYGGNSLQ